MDFSKAMGWIRDDFGKDQKVYVEPVNLFPGYDSGVKEYQEVGAKVSAYLDKGFREGLAKRGKLADASEPGVLVIKPAITGIVSETQDFKPRQYVLPVAI